MKTKRKGGRQAGYGHAQLMKGKRNLETTHRPERSPILNGGRETELESQIEEFLQWKAARGYTARTLDSMRVSFRFFIGWSLERDLRDPRQITRPILESYQRYLYRYRKSDETPLSFSTQRNRLSALKHLFSWLCRQNYLQANPAADLEMPRTQKRLLHKALDPDEINRVLSVPDIEDPLGLRDRAILELLYSCGLRRGEVTDLRLEDVDFKQQTVFVNQGKGQKDRFVPIGRRALGWLDVYLQKARPLLLLHSGERTFFISSYGEPMSRNSLGNRIKKLLVEGGVTRPGGCHLLRHTCATHLLEGGADIRFIQQILGHAKLDTTAVYTQVSIDRLKQVHSQCHPAES